MEQDVGILEDIAGERAAKRPRITREEPDSDEEVEHILYVRWHGNAGQTKLNKLALKRLEGDKVESLKDLPKELIDSQYPSTSEFPDYFTNSAYIRFTPHVEALALPGDVMRTELRLAVSYKGWEYTVLRKDTSQTSRASGQDIYVMAAEFMGSDPLMAALGLRLALIAYPVVALSKVFLEDVHDRLLAAPDEFKGIL